MLSSRKVIRYDVFARQALSFLILLCDEGSGKQFFPVSEDCYGVAVYFVCDFAVVSVALISGEHVLFAFRCHHLIEISSLPWFNGTRQVKAQLYPSRQGILREAERSE